MSLLETTCHSYITVFCSVPLIRFDFFIFANYCIAVEYYACVWFVECEKFRENKMEKRNIEIDRTERKKSRARGKRFKNVRMKQ